MSIVQDKIYFAKEDVSSIFEYLSPYTKRKLALTEDEESSKSINKLDDLYCSLLLKQLEACGLISTGQYFSPEIKNRINLSEMYQKWLDESFRILESGGYIFRNGQHVVAKMASTDCDSDAVWLKWEKRLEKNSAYESIKSQNILVDSTLRALPEILSGDVAATDILFPNSTFALLDNIYKNNPISDYFNSVLADYVVEYVEASHRGGGGGIRILEIGAGTGGTSETIFKHLRDYDSRVEEYCYTDISQAFLIHAKEKYGSSIPYLNCRLFDVEKDLFEQEFERGTYDIVVATNVLHATHNLRNTLRNSKALLKKNGILLLNEITSPSIFTHLTFGLLEGWWFHDDKNLRVQGSPAVTPSTWENILEGAGFRSVLFPAWKSHGAGQQVIVAESDGVVRQRDVSVVANSSMSDKMIISKKEYDEDCNEKDPVKFNIELKDAAYNQKNADGALAVIDRVVSELKKIVSQALQIPVGRLDGSKKLEMYGIDSILVVKLTNSLKNVFEDISSTVFFEQQTMNELARHLFLTKESEVYRWLGIKESNNLSTNEHKQKYNITEYPSVEKTYESLPLEPQKPRLAPIEKLNIKSCATDKKEVLGIAIIGVSGRYPKSNSLFQFWGNLQSGKHCVTEIPSDRWDHKKYFDPKRGVRGKSYSKWGGFIDGVDQFDPLFFKISPKEAADIDPQERLFLQEAYSCIEDAGYTPENLNENKRVGVYVGVMNSTYFKHASYWSIANRVSYTFDFNGPSMAVDTACSSSLTAIHLALESIQCGSCEIAIAGGINLIIDPVQFTNLSAMSMLSSDDRCRPFGAAADGFVDGEGVGAVILKPLELARGDGDHIYGVVKGSSINAGGKTNGYTVPNPTAQSELIKSVFEKAGIDPREISYIEAHGTGTSLGDPIEIAGLSKAFSEYTNDKNFCSIGSVKSNIGHLESAAGMASLTKVLLQLKYRKLVPSLHAEVLNPQIDFKNTPFRIQRDVSVWERPIIEKNGIKNEYLRLAGLSSYGAGGANAHMLIEEYEERLSEDNDFFVSPSLIVISARTEKQLHEKIEELQSHIERTQYADAELVNIAFTLQVGREGMEHRVAFIAKTIEDLIIKLKAFSNRSIENDEIEYFYQGVSTKNNEILRIFENDGALDYAIEKWISQGREYKLLELWSKGISFDWNKLYGAKKPKRVSLPAYPFEKRRCWNLSDNTAVDIEQESIADNAFVTNRLNKAAEFYALEVEDAGIDFEENYLTFCPFEEKIPSFSFSRVWLNPKENQSDLKLIRDKQQELRRVLFCKEDFSAIQNVMDFGCGYGTDVIQIAQHYTHIKTDGYTITKEQAELGNKRIGEMGLGSRSRIYHRNSAVDSFPDQYDLIIGIEVAVHISDKQSLFRNISNNIEKNGRLLLMDFVSNLMGPIVDPSIEVTIPTETSWIELLSSHNFRIDEIIDVSRQIANFSYDPELEENIKGLPRVFQDNLRVYANQSVALERGWLSYCLFKVQKVSDAPNEELYAYNMQKIKAKRPYSDARSEMYKLAQYKYLAGSNIDTDKNKIVGEGSGYVLSQSPRNEIEEPLEIITFEEVWQVNPAVGYIDNRSRVIVCLCSDVTNQRIIANDLSSLEDDSKVIFISSAFISKQLVDHPCYFMETRNGKAFDDIFKEIKKDYEEIDSILNLWPLEEPDYIRDFSVVTYILQSTALAGLDCKKILIAIQLVEGVDRCYAESWIGFERSIKQVTPSLKIAAIYKESPSLKVDAHDWAQKIFCALRNNVFETSLYCEDIRHVLRYKQLKLNDSSKSMIKTGGTYLITGGLGNLGYEVTKYLAKQYRANLILTGRSKLNDSGAKKLLYLEKLGGGALYFPAGADDRILMQAAIKNGSALFGKINGVIHAAGIVSGTNSILTSNMDVFTEVLAPKVAGTEILNDLIGADTLDFICYFSSTASVLGDFGSCDYAVANRFQNAFANYLTRKSSSSKAIAINWPFWQEGGMGQSMPEFIRRYLVASGQKALATEEGLQLFEKLLKQPVSNVSVFMGQKSKIIKMLGPDKIYKPSNPRNKAAEFYALEIENATLNFHENYLTFCPFEEKIESFSFSKVWLNPEDHQKDLKMIREKQRELRRVLFYKEDLAKVNNVMDFGCGYGTDVIQLAQQFPHVTTDGFTITKEQADLGNRRIENMGLASRACVYHCNSAVDDFPDIYDLIIGIEVAVHIGDKDGLFHNISGHLAGENGRVLLMDFVANLRGPIVDSNIDVTIPTNAEWVEVLSRSGLIIDEIIDVSPQIANFCYDPLFEKNIQDLPLVFKDNIKAYANQSIALEKGWISYCLFKLEKAKGLNLEQLLVHNTQKLKTRRPYFEARLEMERSSKSIYPSLGKKADKSNEMLEDKHYVELKSKEPTDIVN